VVEKCVCNKKEDLKIVKSKILDKKNSVYYGHALPPKGAVFSPRLKRLICNPFN
jgi:hypothetical protein